MTISEDNALVVRKRSLRGLDQWWIGRGSGKNFKFYADIFSPTGYGFRSKTKAEKIAAGIEERLQTQRGEL